MYFMGCFPFGSGPSHPEPHYWHESIGYSELERERSSLDPPTPILFLTNLYFVCKKLFCFAASYTNAAPKCIDEDRQTIYGFPPSRTVRATFIAHSSIVMPKICTLSNKISDFCVVLYNKCCFKLFIQSKLNNHRASLHPFRSSYRQPEIFCNNTLLWLPNFICSITKQHSLFAQSSTHYEIVLIAPHPPKLYIGL